MKSPGPRDKTDPNDPSAFSELPTAAVAYAYYAADSTIAVEAAETSVYTQFVGLF